MGDVIIQNGIEVEVDDKEYLRYLQENHKPVSWAILEELEGV